jgi:hypothetical protein
MAMRSQRLIVAGLGLLGAALVAPGVGGAETVHADLDGYNETLLTLSSPGSASSGPRSRARATPR